MAEYNKLTKTLLEEGYTADNYPKDEVHIAHCYLNKENPLDNFYGGFEYNRIYCDSFTYKTGCGMHVKGKNVISNMVFMSEGWCHENDNPVIRCPYDKPECPDNDPRLHCVMGGGLCIQCFCVCHRTDEQYDYKRSFEKVEKERQEEKKRKYQEYSDAHNGRVCENHMFYDERTRNWSQRYEPTRCAHICYSQYGYCPILGRQLSNKRGNVYYDLKTSGAVRKEDAQMSLFDKNRYVHIAKGIRYLKKPCSMDICEAIVKTSADDIRRKYEMNHSFERMFDDTYQFEIYNIRAESKPSRDLMQDLQDIRDGIEIKFEDDMLKERNEKKKENREKRKQKAIEKLEKKILEVGYWNMETFSIDRVHADKWLGEERINELEEIRNQKLKEEQEKPVQLSLFDMN